MKHSKPGEPHYQQYSGWGPGVLLGHCSDPGPAPGGRTAGAGERPLVIALTGIKNFLFHPRVKKERGDFLKRKRQMFLRDKFRSSFSVLYLAFRVNADQREESSPRLETR